MYRTIKMAYRAVIYISYTAFKKNTILNSNLISISNTFHGCNWFCHLYTYYIFKKTIKVKDRRSPRHIMLRFDIYYLFLAFTRRGVFTLRRIIRLRRYMRWWCRDDEDNIDLFQLRFLPPSHFHLIITRHAWAHFTAFAKCNAHRHARLLVFANKRLSIDAFFLESSSHCRCAFPSRLAVYFSRRCQLRRWLPSSRHGLLWLITSIASASSWYSIP